MFRFAIFGHGAFAQSLDSVAWIPDTKNITLRSCCFGLSTRQVGNGLVCPAVDSRRKIWRSRPYWGRLGSARNRKSKKNDYEDSWKYKRFRHSSSSSSARAIILQIKRNSKKIDKLLARFMQE